MSPLKIAESEWQVMMVVWAQAPVTASDVVEALNQQRGWKPRTTRTLLDRLVRKKALKFNSDLRPGQYEPLVTMSQAIRTESQSFVERVFAGEPVSMLLHMVSQTRLSREDIKKLREILSEKEK